MTIVEMRDSLLEMRNSLRPAHKVLAKDFAKSLDDYEDESECDAALDRLVLWTRAIRSLEEAVDIFGVLVASERGY